jgi:hypothetical protein
MQQYLSSMLRTVRSHPALSGIAALTLVFVLLYLNRTVATPMAQTETARSVRVATVSDLSAHTTPLPLLGTVVKYEAIETPHKKSRV